MRSYVTFVIIAAMCLGLVLLLLGKERPRRDACQDGGVTDCVPTEVIPPAEPDAGDGGALDAAGPVVVAPEAAAPKPADKPIRVAALGWDLVAAGVALTPTDGGTSSPPMELAPEASLDAIADRLARGGDDAQGADVAIVPLPAFVVAFERLQKLDPRAFLVAGFSRGREEVHAAPGALLKAPPGADEVKLVAFAPATKDDASARAAGSEAATVLGLFALDMLGVAPSRIRFVAPGTPEAKAAPLSAIVRGAVDERKVGFSTTDASRLVPIVAIAPKALLDTREPQLREWSKAWLDGLVRAGKDASNVARRLAAKENVPLAAGIGAAPEAVNLVDRLGQIEDMTLDRQRAFLGPDARGSVTIDALLHKTWQLARSGGLTTSAAPQPLPIDPRVVNAIAPPPVAPPPPRTEGDGGTFGSVPANSTTLCAYRSVDGDAGDASAVASQIALLSGVFERAVFRISAKGGAKGARGIAAAARDLGVPEARLVTATTDPQGAFAAVEILAPP